MSLEREIKEHCPLLDERLENLRRANTAQNRYYVECDLKILRTINPILYNVYIERFKNEEPQLYKHLNTTNQLH